MYTYLCFFIRPKLQLWVRVLIWGVRISAHFMVSGSTAVVKVIPQPTYIITLEIAFQYCNLLARQRFYFVTTMLIVCSDQLIYIICHLLGIVLCSAVCRDSTVVNITLLSTSLRQYSKSLCFINFYYNYKVRY